MKIIIHDLTSKELEELDIQGEYEYISSDIKAAHCQGCFGCWAKGEGKCVYKDKLQYIAALLAQCEEIIIISKNCYGGYSAGIKKIFDRAVSDSLPFFTYRSKRMHHVARYKNRPIFRVYMYGEINDFEKEITKEFVKANAANFNYQKASSTFLEDVKELKGEL